MKVVGWIGERESCGWRKLKLVEIDGNMNQNMDMSRKKILPVLHVTLIFIHQ